MRPSTEQQAQARTLYAAVKAIPYATDGAHEAGDLDACGSGNCHAKAWRLHEGLTSIGYEARVVRWAYELTDPYRSLLPSSLDLHTAVEVCIDDEWRVVDATLDDDLREARWDGLGATSPAFEPCSPVWVVGGDDEHITAALRQIARAHEGFDGSSYSRAFNAWLRELRAGRHSVG